jgi:hypothetical protein
MERAMDMFARAADNLGIKKLSQFVGEIHCLRLPTITVIPSAVEGSRCNYLKAFAAGSLDWRSG